MKETCEQNIKIGGLENEILIIDVWESVRLELGAINNDLDPLTELGDHIEEFRDMNDNITGIEINDDSVENVESLKDILDLFEKESNERNIGGLSRNEEDDGKEVEEPDEQLKADAQDRDLLVCRKIYYPGRPIKHGIRDKTN